MSRVSEHARRWAEFKVPNKSKQHMAASVAGKLFAYKDRYVKIAKLAGIPASKWFVIAVAHERECSGSFNCNMAQGDPWNRVSTHEPKRQGPFASFEDAAVNALLRSPPFMAKNADWSIGGTLAILEMYNGLGYFNKGVVAPYIWAGTDQYVKGKYTSDHHYDANHVDEQLGVAIIIKEIQKLDPTVFADGYKAEGATSIGIIGPVTVGAQQAAESGMPWYEVTGIVLVGLIIAVTAVYFIRKWKNKR